MIATDQTTYGGVPLEPDAQQAAKPTLQAPTTGRYSGPTATQAPATGASAAPNTPATPTPAAGATGVGNGLTVNGLASSITNDGMSSTQPVPGAPSYAVPGQTAAQATQSSDPFVRTPPAGAASDTNPATQLTPQSLATSVTPTSKFSPTGPANDVGQPSTPTTTPTTIATSPPGPTLSQIESEGHGEGPGGATGPMSVTFDPNSGTDGAGDSPTGPGTTGGITGGNTTPATPPATPASTPGGLDPNTLMQLMQQLFGNSSGATNASGGVTGATNAGASPTDNVSSIDPTNDLRSSIITNDPDPRTQSYTDMVDSAANQLPTNRTDLVSQLVDSIMQKNGNLNVAAGPGVSSGPSARLTGLQGEVDNAASGLAGVDRYKLAQDKFGTYASATDPSVDLAIRKATQKAAAMGGLGSGGLTTDYGNIALARSRDLQNERDSLFQDALNGSIQDQFNKTSQLSGLEGQLSGEEQTQANAARAERQYGTDVATGNVNRDLTAAETAQGQGQQLADSAIGDQRTNLNTLDSLQQQAQAANVDQANAIRGERSYQTGEDQTAINNAVQQWEMQQQAQAQNFNQGLQEMDVAGIGNPASTIATTAGQVNPALDMNAIAQLASSLGRNSAAPPASGTGTDGAPTMDLASLQQIMQMIQQSNMGG